LKAFRLLKHKVVRQVIPYVDDTFTEKSLSAADSAVFIEQYVGVTPSMHSRTRCEKFDATDVNVAK